MYYSKYRKKQKIKYAIITTITIALITVIVLFLGYDYKQTDSTVELPVEKTISEPQVIEKGVFKVTHNYKCGHQELTEESIPLKFIGKTIDEVKEYYPNYSSLSYSDKSLYGEINEIVKCEKHYRIQLNENSLFIYCEKTPDKPIKKLNIDLKGMYEEEIELLKSGIEFGDKNAMLEFIEDFES